MSSDVEPAAPPHPADARPPAAATPVPVGTAPPSSEATKIEQTRATAEVLAMVEAARAFPRSRARAIARMEDACGTMLLAERAFYEYRRAGSTITGSTIDLMVELAGCWGNITHGVYELHHDRENRQSELMAFAWDLETNHRVAQSFVVEWRRDKSDKPDGVALQAQRDIYENNANAGSRRMREAIRKVLPAWFVEAAEAKCRATLEHGGGVPLDQRIARTIKAFDDLGVGVDRLEQHRERPAREWTPYDLAQLHISWVAIGRREVRVDDVFPKDRVTADEIRAQAEAQSAVTDAQALPAANPGVPGPDSAEDLERPF